MTAATPQPEPRGAAVADAPAVAVAEQTTLLADTHVHVYPHYDRAAFLDAAAGNVARQAEALTPGPPCVGGLMMTELAAHDFFASIKRGLAVAHWSPKPTEEDCSAWLEHDDTGTRLLVTAGRQAVSSEGVELLTLCCTDDAQGGRPLAEMVEAGLDAGAVCVLPWGVGKWLGRRGGVVSEVFDHFQSRGLLLGDNAGRPMFIGEPALFGKARRMGSPVLRGSDPLNTRRGQGVAGSYGTAVRLALDPQHPAAALRRALRDPAGQRAFGRRTGLGGFVSDQLGLRWRKLVSK